ncbi:MAG: DUF2490 domain-containing protein [Acidobacteriota bacterium]|nr:DUF2490 domain-containing protein [Acidobacteriota bacterium]
MKKSILLFVVLLATQTSVYTQEPNEGDIQVWNETKVYFKSIKKDDKKLISPYFMGTLRIGQDVRHFVSERIGVGFDVQLNKYFKLTPSYYYIAEQPTKNKKSIEHRIRLDFEGEKQWSKFSLSNRNRVEHRLRFGRDNSTRYRNKTKFKYPINNSDGEEIITPFVANEPYYDFSAKRWTRNEFSAGIGKKFTSKSSGEFYYLLQNNIGNTLKRVNVFGVNLKFTID